MTEFSTRYALVILLTLLVTAPIASQVTPARPKKTATISGKVSIKDRGAPGVVVSIKETRPPFLSERMPRATTDQDGIYHITGVAPGQYLVLCSAGGYVVNDGVDPMRTLVVAEGENLEGVDLSLIKGGVITGKITDEDNRPAIQREVTLYTLETLSSGPQTVTTRSSRTEMTDDRGVYRFFGLRPGHFKVSSGTNSFSGSPGQNPVLYEEVFFPNTSKESEAATLDLTEGSEVTDVNIRLSRPTATFSVSGRVINTEAKNSAVGGVSLNIHKVSGNRGRFHMPFISTNRSGEFTVEGLSDGTYELSLSSDSNLEVRLDSQPFTIAGQNVEGLELHLIKAASVNGVVVLDTQDPKVLAKLSGLRLFGYVSHHDQPPSSPQSVSGMISPDGTFHLGGLPAGMLILNLGSFGMGRQEFSILRIECNGVEQPNGIEIKEGDENPNVRLFISYGTATLRGTVNVVNGTLPPEARIIVLLSIAGQSRRPVTSAATDSRGHFLIEDVPPGTYEISLLLSQSPKAQSYRKQSVTLEKGTTSEVALTLDLATKLQ